MLEVVSWLNRIPKLIQIDFRTEKFFNVNFYHNISLLTPNDEIMSVFNGHLILWRTDRARTVWGHMQRRDRRLGPAHGARCNVTTRERSGFSTSYQMRRGSYIMLPLLVGVFAHGPSLCCFAKGLNDRFLPLPSRTSDSFRSHSRMMLMHAAAGRTVRSNSPPFVRLGINKI